MYQRYARTMCQQQRGSGSRGSDNKIRARVLELELSMRNLQIQVELLQEKMLRVVSKTIESKPPYDAQ